MDHVEAEMVPESLTRALLHRAGLAAALFLAIPGAAAMSAPDDTLLVAKLQRLEAAYGGHLGLAAKDLRTGRTAGYNPAERFPTASVIKLPVMAAYFQRVRSAGLDPTTLITLTEEEKKPGSGVLQFLSGGSTLTLETAVRLMIIQSDNTATNMVLDRLGETHQARLAWVNEFLLGEGLKNTRLLNRLYSPQSKQLTPEGIRYGIGVATPEDMVLLMEKIHRRTLVDSAASAAMLAILKDQAFNDGIPRFLPVDRHPSIVVAHKTGSVNESKGDVALVLSERADIALAIFVDKNPDHLEITDNRANLLIAHAARAVWNHFTGETGDDDRTVPGGDVDWNLFPGGKWGIWRSREAAPFPHPDRAEGYRRQDGTFYPAFPHYLDSSIAVVVPLKLREGPQGVNLIVHFHGHMNDNMGVLERFPMVQTMLDAGTNAILVLPQGPYRARDSFGGKMEDAGGLRRLVEQVLAVMKKEGVIKEAKLADLILSAHSGGYRPLAFCLDRGGMNASISRLFLFDAFYGNHDFYEAWLLGGKGIMLGAYTDHLAKEHTGFVAKNGAAAGKRLQFTPTAVEHNDVLKEFLPGWLRGLPDSWKVP